MKIFKLIFLCFLISSFCEAQIDSSSVTFQRVNKRIADLQHKRVANILVYHVNCTGKAPRLMIADSCTTYEVAYLMWLDMGMFVIQRFDECKAYKSSIVKSAIFDFINRNYPDIKRGNIKFPQFVTLENGKPVIYDEVIDHSCYDIYTFYRRSEILDKGVNLFACLHIALCHNQAYLFSEQTILRVSPVRNHIAFVVQNNSL